MNNEKNSILKIRFFYLFLFFCLSIYSCKNTEYSPSQVFDKHSYKDLNASNLKRLGTGLQDDTVRFIVTGDTQRSYDEVVKFYKKVNAMPGIDFVVVAGDVTEFGTLNEMQWLAERFNRLTVPYITIIGNHDLTLRGSDAFVRMFGPLNFTFTYGGVKFVCHDSNSREYSFNGLVPNIPWLESELQPEDGVSNYVAISHVPPNSDDFDINLIGKYTRLFAGTPGMLASFHGHNHNFSEFRYGHSPVPYVVSSSLGNGEFLLVEIINNKLNFEQVPL